MKFIKLIIRIIVCAVLLPFIAVYAVVDWAFDKDDTDWFSLWRSAFKDL